MRLDLDEDTLKHLSKTIDDILHSIERKDDIRKTIGLMRPLQEKLDAAVTIRESPEGRFVHFLVWVMYVQVRGVYAGGDEEWYKLNAENIEGLRPILSQYFSSLKQSLSSNSYEDVLEACKNFFFSFHSHTRALTPSE